jgi:hypothetical protein
LQTKEGLSLRHVIQNTMIYGILRAAVGKTFDQLNGHHIPCNLVAYSMLTFPIPWYLLLLGIGCVNLKKVIVFPPSRYILFLKTLWPILIMKRLHILGSLRDLALMTFNCFSLTSSCLGCWCKRLAEVLLNYLVEVLYHQTWCVIMVFRIWLCGMPFMVLERVVFFAKCSFLWVFGQKMQKMQPH